MQASAVPSAPETYEVFALRYAVLAPRDATRLFVHYGLFDLEGRQLGMACYFWVIRSNSRVVLVDSGYRGEVGARRLGALQLEHRDPVEMLAQLDLTAGDVEHVIISHLHFDHTGNLGRFPNATFTVAGTELDYWTGPYRDRLAFNYHTLPEDVDTVSDLARDGRVQTIGHAAHPYPGIVLTKVGGHSPGQLIVEVNTASGLVVLAADAIHYHEEYERDLPFWVHTDLVEMFGAYELLRERAARPRTWVVAGHDPAEMDRFEGIGEHCLDLTKPIG